MIGGEASELLRRMKRLLRRHGAAKETVCVVAETLGFLCNRCLMAMERSVRED
jgi:hypothetical protein